MRYIPVLTAVMLLTGCNAARQTPSVMPTLTPPQAYVEPEERYENPGSLFLASETDTLFADSRARRVGDIVMVKIVENHKAKNKEDVSAEKTNTTSNSVDAFFGKSSASAILPLTGLGTKVPVGKVGYGSTTGSKFESTGETNREGTVTATIAARVTRVLPGNLMQIEGVRQTRVNNETQYMVVTGLIRPMDVAPDNSIESNRIADAQIAYYGQGTLSEKEKPGWFTRLVDNAWPF